MLTADQINEIRRLKIGKRMPTAVYLHRSALGLLSKGLADAVDKLASGATYLAPNAVKLRDADFWDWRCRGDASSGTR